MTHTTYLYKKVSDSVETLMIFTEKESRTHKLTDTKRTLYFDNGVVTCDSFFTFRSNPQANMQYAFAIESGFQSLDSIPAHLASAVSNSEPPYERSAHENFYSFC